MVEFLAGFPCVCNLITSSVSDYILNSKYLSRMKQNIVCFQWLVQYILEIENKYENTSNFQRLLLEERLLFHVHVTRLCYPFAIKRLTEASWHHIIDIK